MPPEAIRHLTDTELLRFIDSESSAAATHHARQHLALCAECRARRFQLESAAADLLQLHQPSLNGTAAAREQLCAKLNAAPPPTILNKLTAATPLRWALLAAALVLVVFAASQHARLRKTTDAYLFIQMVPNSQLTPGATRPVRLDDICRQDEDNDLDPAVSPTLQKAVFQEYGMDNAPAQNYQVDYLINPQLGGTADLRNLWPEPYASTVWNARAKDALEDRLHQMVCQQQIDLASAQREIATDWIAAYKKYFHTPRPL